MPLESTIICLDNSEWMRNGDYSPSRLEAQHDAANLVCGTKTQANPESSVGVLTMSGMRAEVLVSPTDDIGKILASMCDIPMKGVVNLASGLQIAQLALKHRRNKHGSQRIIAFLGSPVSEDVKALTKVGKLLKKNNVALDIISMGETDENNEKLEELVKAANSSDNSHLVTIPPGITPSDILISSPIIQGDTGGGGGGGGLGSGAAGGAAGFTGGGGADDFGGVDPNMDPELAMALRVSMEEERARQEAANKVEADSGDGAAAPASAATPAEGTAADATSTTTEAVPSTPAAAAAPSETPPAGAAGASGADEGDRLLQEALQLSMDQEAAAAAQQQTTSGTASGASGGTAAAQDDDMDEEMRSALAMSMQEEASGSSSSSSAGTAPPQFLDPSFVNQLLGSMPGVDPNDARIKEAVAQVAPGEGKDAEEGKKDDSGSGEGKKDDGPK